LLMGIVAAGLVISDVVTYNSLQSFLTTRVDQQLEAAAFPVGRALLSSSGLGPQVPAAPRTFPVPGGSNPFKAPGAFRNGGGLLRGTTRGVLIPPGTYGQLRTTKGTVEAHLFFAYGGKAPRAPAIPAKLPGSGLPAGKDYYFTTSSTGTGAVSYRAVAKPLADRTGVIVVALPLADLESTLRRLLAIELIVSAAVLVGLGVLSWVMVRRDLRPLESMTKTAGAIAQGDLSQRVSPVAERTEVGQLGQAFNTMLDEIEVAFAERAASEDRLRRFLADASHELRTPLTSILGYSELFDLGMRDRPADVAVSLRHIRDEATRMATLVDDLFLLAQLDQERPLRFEPVDLVALARRTSEGLSVSAPDRPVTMVGDGPVTVDGDPDRLRQVVDNLAVNATRHTPDGAGVEIRVAEDGPWAVVTVHDDGPGIDPRDAARIFEPFYRSDPSRARSSGGAGLGLAIVAAIVQAHQGTVTLIPGRGATFEVRLPRAQDHGEVRAPARVREANRAGGAEEGQARTADAQDDASSGGPHRDAQTDPPTDAQTDAPTDAPTEAPTDAGRRR
jgi:two-component system, OmpR family, sensor kinase